MNLYRLSLKPYGQGSRVTIDTSSEMVSSLMRVKDSQYQSKDWVNTCHIALLIMANLLSLAPQFINEGRLCWLRSPLYIVTKGKKEDYYYNDEEFNAAKLAGKVSGEIHRNKGLGELSPEAAHESMFTDKYQRLEILNPTPEALKQLEELMGDEVSYRKDFIMNNVDFKEIRE